jgi:hypothetical protein
MPGHRLSRCCAAGCALLFALATAAETPDVVPELDKVEGIQKLKAPPAARELLKRNGFVVVPRFYHQIFSPYIHEGLPPFVTTDSLHRTFHVIFEEQIKKLETALAADVAAISVGMANEFNALRQAGDLTAEGAESARLAETYFSVAAALLGEKTKGGTDAGKLAAGEVKLIGAAHGVARSPLFGYDVDYSQFKPRGFYTETPLLRRYFQTMSWYGNAVFRLASDRETRAAILIAEAFAANKDAQERWKKIDRLYTHLIAPADDLTPEEYAGIIRSMQVRRIIGDPFEWFKKAAARLRDPKINSMVLTLDEIPRWRELGKGMCFFGKRFVPDSEVFMSLVHPSVPGRLWPSGLDVMAVLGSTRARELQHAAGEATLPGYGEGFSKSRKTLDDLLAAKDRSHYVETLRLAQTLLAPPGPEALPFMKTPAYTDKNLMTALALWTSLRHTWQLQAKQSVGLWGVGDTPEGPPPGWIEPNFPFYERLHRLITRTLEVLGSAQGEGKDRLKALDALVLRVLAIGRKQAAGEALTPEDRCFFDSEFADELESLHGTDFAPNTWMSLATDVHSQLLGGECLEEAIGGAMPIFVVVPRGAKQYLMVGGTYSHYEFRQPIAQRLTDEEWRDRVSSGNLPPMAVWAGSFVAGFDVTALLKRIENGQTEEDILFVNGPAIEAFLEKAVEPGGPLEGRSNLSWAVEMLGKKAGKKALPKLLDFYLNPRGPRKGPVMLPNGKVEEREFYTGGPRAEGAARVLGQLAEPEHLPMFEKVAREGEVYRAESAVQVIADIHDKKAEGSLVKIAQDAAARGRGEAIRYLGWRGSRDVTPALLELWEKASGNLRGLILSALAGIWAEPEPGEPADDPSPPWPIQMDEPTARELRRKFDALVLRAIADPAVEEHLIEECVPRLKLREAIPILETRIFARDPSCATTALRKLGGPEAVRALLRLTYVAEAEARGDSTLEFLLEALAELRSPLAAPRALELLAQSQRAPIDGNFYTATYAASVLSGICPDGPEWPQKPVASDIARLLAAWRDHLTKRGIATEEPLAKEEAAALVPLLLQRARDHARPAEPARALACLLSARRMLGDRRDAAAAEMRKRIGERLVSLAHAEVRDLARSISLKERRDEDFGAAPGVLPNAPIFDALKGVAYLDPARVTAKGYLDPWGNAYQYLKPGKHSKEPFEIYSFGPNGKDEDGGGDDIASWRNGKTSAE